MEELSPIVFVNMERSIHTLHVKQGCPVSVVHMPE